MFVLSSPSITDHSEYKYWTPLSGRLKCFEKLRENLELIYPVSKDELKIPHNSFNEFIYNTVVTVNKDFINIKNSANLSLSLLNMRRKDETGLLVIDDDIKMKNKSLKDDNDIFLKKSTNSLLRAKRNEKVSQSLQINKISEMDENNYNRSSGKKLLKSNNEINEKSFQEVEVDFSDIDEETVINNKKEKEISNHALSDLDKEEYYMKSCYEFYDYVKKNLFRILQILLRRKQ